MGWPHCDPSGDVIPITISLRAASLDRRDESEKVELNVFRIAPGKTYCSIDKVAASFKIGVKQLERLFPVHATHELFSKSAAGVGYINTNWSELVLRFKNSNMIMQFIHDTVD